MPNWTKEQTDAIKKDGTSIIVSAGAGSGKTAVLSERVIEKLKHKVSIDELLILTFTNAAAKEMKERIRKKIINEKITSELIKLDVANITTFDAYALSIVKKYSYLLNISKNLSIVDSSIISIKKEEFLDSIFEDLYKENNEQFLTLINDFCVKDDDAIKKSLLTIRNKLDMIYDINSYLDNYINNYYNENFIDKLVKEFNQLLINKLDNIRYLINELTSYADIVYIEKLEETLDNVLNLKSYEDIKNISIKLPSLPRNSSDEVKELKKKISLEFKDISELCIYNDINDIKSSIYKTKDYVEILITIIKKLNSKLDEYKHLFDVYEFNDIAKLAIKLVSENENIRNEIKNNLNEIMIDEYQDTNDLQDLFISYISNNNVYMVGDIKQSIYRFRNANPSLFKNKYDNYSSSNGGIKIDLNKNFRSRKEVIDSINEVFNSIMSDNIGGADYIKSHQMIFGNITYEENKEINQNNNLEIYNYEFNRESVYKKEEIEAFIIANDIKNKVDSNYKVLSKSTNKLDNIKYSDIAILMDRSVNFNLYKKIFEYLNIPLAVYRDEELTDSVDISIIKNIINLLLSNSYDEVFKYSFMSIMRSYLFNISDSIIFEYIVNSNYIDSELMKIIKSIDINNSLENIVISIIDKFDFYNKMITVGDIESHTVALEYIINISRDLNNMGYTLNSFYEYLNKILESSSKYKISYSTSKNEEAVKIMTIHASKGLEYSVCYFSGMYNKFNISDMKENFLFDNKYGIITPIIDNGIKNTIYKSLAKNNYLIDEISEKIRLLYVALTRSKEKIIIVIPNNENLELEGSISNYTKLKYNSFLSMLNSIKQKLNKYSTIIDLNKIGLTRNYDLTIKKDYKKLIDECKTVLNVNKLNIENKAVENKHMSKESFKLYNSENLNNINFGKKVHSIMENMDFNNPNYSGIDEFIACKIKRFINLGLFNSAINIYKEHEFIYEIDNIEYHGIIDLLIEYDDCYKIIDYKLRSIDDLEYINQLKGYKKYIESITSKNVSIYLYSIIDETLKSLE